MRLTPGIAQLHLGYGRRGLASAGNSLGWTVRSGALLGESAMAPADGDGARNGYILVSPVSSGIVPQEVMVRVGAEAVPEARPLTRDDETYILSVSFSRTEACSLQLVL